MSEVRRTPPATATPRVICVLVNWNGGRDTIACLDSLRLQDYPAFEVVVVDNGSTDDSVERIRQAHPWVQLLETGVNLGFAAGCNQGTRLAYQRGADLIWLLNNDTVCPPQTASILVRTAQEHPGAGAVGAVLNYMYDPAKVQAWGGGCISLWSAYARHFRAPTRFAQTNSYITGASLLLPRAVCEQVGIFYEGFFMYGDDADLSLRLRRAGYALVVAEDTAILHKEGASSARRSPRIDELQTTSMIRLLLRHAPAPFLAIPVYLTLRLANRVRRAAWANLAAVLRGILVAWRERSLQFTDRL